MSLVVGARRRTVVWEITSKNEKKGGKKRPLGRPPARPGGRLGARPGACTGTTPAKRWTLVAMERKAGSLAFKGTPSGGAR